MEIAVILTGLQNFFMQGLFVHQLFLPFLQFIIAEEEEQEEEEE